MALLFQENTTIYMLSSLYLSIKEGNMIRIKPRLAGWADCIWGAESVYSFILMNVDSFQTVLVQK